MKKISFLLLGTNLGDRKKNLSSARKVIERSVGVVVKTSSLYQTAAWGNTDQPDFFNQALEVHTSLSADGVLKEILKIEQAMGRTRDVKWGARIMDIDILLYEKEIIDLAELKVPHPQLQHRRFALAPLAEIAAAERHPILGLTVQELLDRCTDPLQVHSIKE